MPKKTDPKYAMYKAAERAKEREKRSQEIRTLTLNKRLPIPEVDEDLEEWEAKLARIEMTDKMVRDLRRELLKRWCNDFKEQVIIVCDGTVSYRWGFQTITIELTARGAWGKKEWLETACGEILKEKSHNTS